MIRKKVAPQAVMMLLSVLRRGARPSLRCRCWPLWRLRAGKSMTIRVDSSFTPLGSQSTLCCWCGSCLNLQVHTHLDAWGVNALPKPPATDTREAALLVDHDRAAYTECDQQSGGAHRLNSNNAQDALPPIDCHILISYHAHDKVDVEEVAVEHTLHNSVQTRIAVASSASRAVRAGRGYTPSLKSVLNGVDQFTEVVNSLCSGSPAVRYESTNSSVPTTKLNSTLAVTHGAMIACS